jgi:hypothetical protein
MQRHIIKWISLCLLLALVAGCQPTTAPAAPTAVPPTAIPPTAVPPTAAPAAGTAALVITGLVDKETSFTMDELHAMDVVTLEAEHPKKGKQTNTGVRLNALLALAGPKAEAATLEFLAGDGFTGEAPMADVLACADCLIAFNESGQLKSVMPGMASNLWVKDVIKITLK